MLEGALWCEERVVVPSVARTTRAWERARGLLGRRALPAGHGLLITPCGAVHTLGMRLALDLVFLDAGWRVVRTVAAVPPWRLAVWGGPRARHTLEVQAGWLDLDAWAGRVLRWQNR